MKIAIIQKRYFLFLIAIIVLVSCEPTKSLKSAKTMYNQAAVIELDCRLDLYMEKITSLDNCPSRSDFEKVINTSEGLLKEYNSQLAQGELLGDVYSLIALANYNLGQNEQAELSAGKALKLLQANTDKEPRSLALMSAIPGLIKANQLFDKVPTDENADPIPTSEYNTLEALAQSALTDIEKGQKEAELTHPVQTYLINSKLAVIRNWMEVNAFTVGKDSTDEEIKQKRERESEILKMGKMLIEELGNASGVTEQMLTNWRMIIGVA